MYYMITTVSAVILGIILVTTIRPGEHGSALDQNIADSYVAPKPTYPIDTLLDLIR